MGRMEYLLENNKKVFWTAGLVKAVLGHFSHCTAVWSFTLDTTEFVISEPDQSFLSNVVLIGLRYFGNRLTLLQSIDK